MLLDLSAAFKIFGVQMYIGIIEKTGELMALFLQLLYRIEGTRGTANM
jgi:hypothetical protein